MMAWQAAFGIVILLGLAWACSENRFSVSWRLVVVGILLQFACALLLLRLEPVENAFEALNQAVLAVQAATWEGTAFVFGYLGGGDAPFATAHPEHALILAFQGLPLILLVSVLSALLFHWRVLPLIVRGFAWVLRKVLNIGGVVGVSVAANVFVGMIEAPLLVRPYLRDMSRAGLFMVMTAGMATIAGNMFVLYAIILAPVVPDAAGNLMTASLISVPAAIAVAALLVPGVDKGKPGGVSVLTGNLNSSVEAIIRGHHQWHLRRCEAGGQRRGHLGGRGRARKSGQSAARSFACRRRGSIEPSAPSRLGHGPRCLAAGYSLE